ncbi:MAG TPA: putative protein N(5)-glutamine methyltransferase [Streptosporangiaceae bacterium]|nr:putative protein N(5)-glutamine methyltransferase [Streptosporangiaceae bacterium]
MEVSSSPAAGPPASVVARLRAAGCVFAEDEARLLSEAARDQDELDDMVGKRAAGLPLEHIVGWAEFCGLRVATDPGVFVPRRRTEFLISQAAALTPAGAVVVDLCCGSGAMGLALAVAADVGELYAADLDEAAVRCARRNLDAIGGKVSAGDLFGALPERIRGRIGTLIANVPYVPSGEVALLPAEARLHEARLALDGGDDGLDVLRRVVAGAPQWLAPGGQLLIETSERQAPAAMAIFERHGLRPVLAASEEYAATVIIGTAPGA